MFWERADIFLLIMCIICSLFGIYMVRIATIAMEASGWVDSSIKCVIVQVFSLFLGLIAFVVFTFIDAEGEFQAEIMGVDHDGHLNLKRADGRLVQYAFKEVQFVI